MHALRTSSTLIRLVLAVFALTLGVAMASPLVAPRMLEMVCSDGGAMKLVVLQDGEAVETGHTLDCAMCLPAALAAPSQVLSLPQPQPLAHALTLRQQAHIAALVSAPLPPRGPPFLA